MTFQIAIEESAIAFGCEAGETVLDAAERAGYSLPYSCRKGICSTCDAELRDGKVVSGTKQIAAPAREVLLCQAKPQTDIVIRPKRIDRHDPTARKKITASVYRVSRPADDVVHADAALSRRHSRPLQGRPVFARDDAGRRHPQFFDGQCAAGKATGSICISGASPAGNFPKACWPARKGRQAHDRNSVRRILSAHRHRQADRLPRDRHRLCADQIHHRRSDRARQHRQVPALLGRPPAAGYVSAQSLRTNGRRGCPG